MNTQEYLLSCLSEECCELAQESSKVQRFGLNDNHPKYEPNEVRLNKEFNDILAVIEILNDNSIRITHNRDAINAKKIKLIKYMEYSKKLGTLKD